MKRSINIFFLALGLLVLGLIFTLGPVGLCNVYANNQIIVFVSILPQKYFVKQIAGDLVDVKVMVEPGANPAIYEPKPRQMEDISKASLYFAIGVPFEKRWLPKIGSSNPNMKIIPTHQGIQKIPMSTHYHGEEEGIEKEMQYEHENLDPHIWLSPPYVIFQARQILTALQVADPNHHLEYEKNYKGFIQEIIDLDEELRNLFQDKRGFKFMVFHPSWGYFAQVYGLIQISIEIEGKEPKAAKLRKIIQHAREDNIKVIFVQPQFSAKSARQLAREIDGEVVFADPLAENWTANLRKQSEVIRKALR